MDKLFDILGIANIAIASAAVYLERYDIATAHGVLTICFILLANRYIKNG
jgi:hypothetical protein